MIADSKIVDRAISDVRPSTLVVTKIEQKSSCIVYDCDICHKVSLDKLTSAIVKFSLK